MQFTPKDTMRSGLCSGVLSKYRDDSRFLVLEVASQLP